MADKTGLAAQIGIAEQGAGAQETRAVPTRFYEFLSENILPDYQRVSSNGLRANRKVTQRRRLNRKGIGGPLTVEHPIVGAGLFWKHILGAEVTSTPVGGTLARDHTCTLGALDGKFLTVQKGVPRVSGAALSPIDYVGCKVASAQLTQNVDGFLQLETQLDGWDFLTDQALAVASYPTDLDQFFFSDVALTVDGDAYEANDLSLSIDNGLKTDRHKIRGDERKKEQIEATSLDGRNITLSAASDFDGLDIANMYRTLAEFPVVITATSPELIEVGFNFALTITLPRCQADDGVPAVGGPDVVGQPLGMKVLQPSAAEPITVVVRDNLVAA